MEELAEVYARSLFEVAREQGQARRAARAARPVRRRAGLQPRAGRVLLLALLLHQGEAGRAGAHPRRRRRELPELPQAADREPPHAGDLPHPPAVRAPVGAGEPAAAGGHHQRDRARPGDHREPRPADRRARRAQGEAGRARRPRTSSAASCSGWATRSSTPLFATDWSSCAGTLPKEPLRKRHADQPR